MRTFWIVQAGLGLAALGASAALGAACGGTVVGTGTATDTGTSEDTSTETDTETDTDYNPPPPVPCHACACVQKSTDSPPGCADACDNKISGASSPDFCDGAPALVLCKMCILYRCGVSDPMMCD